MDSVFYWESVVDEPDAERPRTSVIDEFCGESRRINSRRPNYNSQILSLGTWCKLRKSAHAIVHEQLCWSKRRARWIPHQLTTEQKEQRAKICRNCLQLFEPDGPKRFSDVVTGDECWISFFTMKDKHSNMVWVAEDEPRPEVLKTGFRSRKRMFTNFFNTQGPVVVDMMPDKATTTAAYYTTTSVLPKVLLHIQSTAQTRRRSRIQLHHNSAMNN